MAIGTLGIGKSTLLNRMSGVKEYDPEPFEAKFQTTGCTQEIRMLPFDDFNLIDTPGLNDPNMTTAEWGTKLNEWTEG